MPSKGYSTIGLKPNVLSLLENLTDTFYPGMFFPSTLIILMNEVSTGRYSVKPHRIAIDMTGRYNTLTVRSDVKGWLDESYRQLAKEYEGRYGVRCFAHFIGYFLANLFESKFDSQRHIIRLKESDFDWLQKQYMRHIKRAENGTARISFERFSDYYINELFQKIKAAREMLTI